MMRKTGTLFLIRKLHIVLDFDTPALYHESPVLGRQGCVEFLL